MSSKCIKELVRSQSYKFVLANNILLGDLDLINIIRPCSAFKVGKLSYLDSVLEFLKAYSLVYARI